jgi:hypothetical protein
MTLLAKILGFVQVILGSLLPLSIGLASSLERKGLVGRVVHKLSDWSLLLILHAITRAFIGLHPAALPAPPHAPPPSFSL